VDSYVLDERARLRMVQRPAYADDGDVLVRLVLNADQHLVLFAVDHVYTCMSENPLMEGEATRVGRHFPPGRRPLR
jgi:hypothetical protein